MLKPLNVCCNRISKTLPLAFDESLSYLEMLCTTLDKLNETIEQVNRNTEVAEHYEELLQEIEQEVNRLEQEYIEFKESIENEIDERFIEITRSLTVYIENQLAVLRYEIQSKYDELNQKIEDIIAGDIEVYDPTTGVLSPIQVVINNLFDMNRTNAITTSEFDALELTATTYDSYEITAFNFDVNAKEILTS
ncbi:MAG: hypothetical protein VZR33_05790 [Methanosphaera sp.]|nr:hypothetical protein [Methanosphaera sp.]